MVDWDATATATAANGGELSSDSQANVAVMDELREALAMVTEKTNECEKLRRLKAELEKELELRQTCIDELMVQMNVMQSQQSIHAENYTQLHDWASRLEREKLDLQSNLSDTQEKLKEALMQLETVQISKEEVSSVL
ncbi:unnamed protein product [Gongylonema pulchrum]|uniref:GOLGA2L5 domain-containing protein n=1 Tax=Gongylonema pulchrum TaxID=637853 RepID=A0A183E5S7_9BILA|nr:unnamed protein product [Gongylonema pulchrum]